jgi:biotin transport system substrate-specific component
MQKDMMMTTQTLAQRPWLQTNSSIWRNVVLAVLGSILVAIAAQISIPMWPVPMTLQTLAVLGIGAAYGSRLGAATLALYALECAVGLPFRAGGQAGIFMPDGALISSGGFLIGFVLAAGLTGLLVEKGWGATPLKTAMATLIGGAVLYIPGLIWLAVWAAMVKGVPSADVAAKAIAWGLTPFVMGDILKALIAGLGVGSVYSMIARRD